MTRVFQQVNGLWSLARPSNVLLFIFANALGGIILQGSTAFSDDGFWMLVLSGTLVGAAANIINDVFDIEIDRINKPLRPLVLGEISESVAIYAWAIFNSLAVLLSFSVSFAAFAIAFFSAILLYVYSRWMKRVIVLGNLVVALVVSASICFGALFTDFHSKLLFPAGLTFIAVFAREILKDAEDIIGDRAGGIETLPTRIGIKKALFIIAFIQGLAILWAISPLMILDTYPLKRPFLYAILIFIFAGITLYGTFQSFGSHTPQTLHQINNLQKIAFLFALLSFAVG
ncbi:MAG: geranylgeranylglycerol-phosphate geranylgeranyltransferase [Chloroherpetonaceae bacterium]|nr:geranylgeranylglycerol-phosphate geranylgeranyltransferase [Chloroherpetonaceae bacterium]